MAGSDSSPTAAEMHEVLEYYRELKHSINNTLAVIMALSELAQRNPAHYEKLAATVLERGPKLVQELQEFQGHLAARLTSGTGAPDEVKS
ncbi:MAG: hypothetical protein M3463_13875 [Verrucomicrobiota bacterium]|nr:hypothetical protein [Verrucomicrobiota bacterium]